MREHILEHIREHGPMPFDAYMERCLYDPDDGFFAAGPVRSGKDGDFVTSPEISEAFGAPVGRWADQHAPSDNASLVEVGAGSGSLTAQIIDNSTMDQNPVYTVELSADARQRHAGINGVTAFRTVTDIPKEIDVVVIANELLDNLPAALARRDEGGWNEITVGIDGGELVLEDMPARDEVRLWCDEVCGDVPIGGVVSVQLAVGEWINAIFNRFSRVSMCLIDYGGTTDELAARSPAEVVRTYRQHKTGIDWLQHPGRTDITVDVNVDGVMSALTRAGGEPRLTSQREFCLEYGLGEMMADAAEREQSAARSGDVMAQLRNRSARLDMEALIDPSGLGAFKVILVG